MSFIKKIGTGAALIAAFFGRRVIAAHYQRGIQSATEVHRKFVGGGLLVAALVIIANFLCVYFSAHGTQTFLALGVFVAGIYYMLAPMISLPLLAIATTGEVAEDDEDKATDKTKLELLRAGLKDVLRIPAIVLVWTLVYIFLTMIAPLGDYPTLFLLLHVPLCISLAALMTGYIKVNPKVYVATFWSGIAIALIGLTTVTVMRDRLDPMMARFGADRSSRVESKSAAEAYRKADRSYAVWYEAYVMENDFGALVVCVKADGTLVAWEGAKDCKAVEARKYIDARKQIREEAFRRLSEKGEVSAGQLGKPGDATNCRYYEPCYWQNKARQWSEEWGLPLFVTGAVVIVLILVHFLPLLLPFWFKKKTEEASTGVKKAEKTTTKSSFNAVQIAVSSILLGAFVVVAMPDVAAPIKARGDRFATNVSQSAGPLVESARSKAIEALGGTTGAQASVPATQGAANMSTGWSAKVTTPGHFYANQQLAMMLDPSIAYLIADPSKAKEVPDGTMVARVFTPDADREYKLLQSRPCGERDGTLVCVGNWLKGPHKGTYEIVPSERKIAFMSDRLPAFEMKIE